MTVRTIHNRKLTGNFTVLPNAMLRHSALSFKARGILAFMLSHADGWEATSEWIATQGAEGREAIRSGVRELEQAGYAVHATTRDVSGQITAHVWTWHSEPVEPSERTNRTKWANQEEVLKNSDSDQTTGSRSMVKPQDGKPSHGNPSDGYQPVQKEGTTERPNTQKNQGKERAASGPASPPAELFQNEATGPDFPRAAIRDAWNLHVPSLAKIRDINGERERAARARYKDIGDMPSLIEFFKRVERSDFLTGRVKGHDGRTFTADFDFCFSPSKFDRINEGKYDNKHPNPTLTPTDGNPAPPTAPPTAYQPRKW